MTRYSSPHSLKGFYRRSSLDCAVVLKKHYLTLTNNNYCAAIILDRLYGYTAYQLNEFRVLYGETVGSTPPDVYQIAFMSLSFDEEELLAFGLFKREAMLEAFHLLEIKGYIENISHDETHRFIVHVDKINPDFWEEEPEDDEGYHQENFDAYNKGIENKRVTYHLKRAETLALPATLTLNQWLTTLKHFDWQCAYCQQSPYQVFEHFTPLFHGGGTTYSNCVPACYKCNVRKSDLHPTVFRDKIGRAVFDRVQQYLRSCGSVEELS